MQEASTFQTPPPSLVHSPRDSASDNTPLNTPIVAEAPWPPQKKHKQRDWHDWHRAPDLVEPLFEDDGDHDFPLFPDSPPTFAKRTMASAAPPLDMSLPPRLNSQSPRNQTSNLTFALQEAGATGQPAPEANNDRGMAIPDSGRLSVSGRQDSISNMFSSSYYGSGARPISMKDRQRRESNNAGSSFMGGMSWGGISVGSLRDDIMMTGTSPMPFGRSPSLHSSSYLPKMEAQFLSGYQCCGKNLDSLHDLLQHFEENHAQQSSQVAHRSSISSQTGSNRRPSNGAGSAEIPRSVTSADQRAMNQPRQNSFAPQRDGFSRTQLSTVQDMDSLEDMEMDDGTGATSMAQLSSPGQLGQGMPALNTSMNPTVPAQQAFRTSTPTTPNPNSAFQLYSNPTVSSVNTPALSTQSLHQSQKSPHTSIPGTPAEINPDFANDYMMSFGMGGMPTQGNSMMPDDFDFGPIGGMGGFGGLATTMNDMTIDDPAKRLFSKAGGMNAQQLAQAIKNGHLPVDAELQKKLREQQLVGGLGGPVIGFPEPETKPFKCPVIGCEKAYKNQNGLKYHKQHGHNNQKLQENNDGTFSIVDPITSIPYPGTIGMEKEKPYRCEVCGKRYKNLNGLKYHRQHSPPCNPDLKMNPLAGLNPNANVAGNLF